jgi:ribose transport system substrate-binding protein
VRPKKLTGAGLAAAAVLALAACSSAASSSSSSSAAAASSAPPASASASAPASAAAGGPSSPTASSSAVSAATAAVNAAAAMPTSIPETQPLSSAPPKGKTVLFLQCEEVQCSYEGDGLKAAAAAIGWTVKVLNFQAANPATLVTALQSGLQYHPVAAFFSGVPQEAWQSEQKAYAAAGAVIVDNYVATTPSGSGVEAGRGYTAENVAIGTVLADEQIADSGGAPAKSLVVNVPAYTLFVPLADAYKAEIAKDCPSCQVSESDFTLPQMLGGQLVPAVVSAAKRISGLKYIVSVNGAFTAQLPQALKAAGLAGKFQLISGQGISLDQQNVLSGSQLATVSGPFIEGGWQDMDMAIRNVMHLPASPGDNDVPWVLLLKSNIGTPSDSYDKPVNYPAQFEKLWHVS